VTNRRLIAVALIVLVSHIALASQPSSLKIVVIEGEDAVNVIQQKTAVRPLVEVRDRNNLPVSGVLVTFSIEGGKAATFGGASTLTVATNAAGQAAVTGLTPSAAGAFHIQVSAAFQGQVATATIAQTNVMTAAQAAAASAAAGSGASGGAGGGAGGSAGGAAGGAGGGMSATTLGVVGAAVAGGAVAATQVVGNKDDGDANGSAGNIFTGTFSGPIVSTSVSRVGNNTCSINRSVNATATIKLATNTATSVIGRIEVQGTDVIVSQTCNGPSSATMFNGTANISGTPASIRGSETRSDTGVGPSGEAIQGNSAMLFEGSLSGNTITGTIKYEQRSSSTGGTGGPVDQAAQGSFSVTLTKS
jgi:hypothetical protein